MGHLLCLVGQVSPRPEIGVGEATTWNKLYPRSKQLHKFEKESKEMEKVGEG